MTYHGALNRLKAELGDLLDQRHNLTGLSHYRQYDGRPLDFYRDVLGWTPWSRQEEAAQAIEDEPFVALVGANGVGKDAFLAVHALYWAYAKGGMVLIQAPTQRQVREVLFGEIAKAWYRAKDLPGELFTSALRFGPESDGGIIGFTSSPGSVSRLTGFHGTRLLGILSEAQGLEQEPLGRHDVVSGRAQ